MPYEKGGDRWCNAHAMMQLHPWHVQAHFQGSFEACLKLVHSVYKFGQVQFFALIWANRDDDRLLQNSVALRTWGYKQFSNCS